MCLSLVYFFIKVYWFAEYFILVCIHWSSWDSQQVDPSCTLSLNCDTPLPPPSPPHPLPCLLQASLFWEGPDTLVGSFTQNNCICFHSGPSRPNPCWVLIVLISRLALFDLRGHVYLGPFHRKWRLRFCFLCGDLKINPKLLSRWVLALTFPLAEWRGFPCLL